MALYNEILVGRFNRALQKLLGLKGGPPAPQLAGEIAPSLPLPWGREMRALESWFTFAFTAGIGAAAGQQSVARMRNPANSNVVAVFERICVALVLTDQPLLQSQASGADLVVTAFSSQQRLDPRGATGSNLIFSSNTVGVPAVALINKLQIAGAPNTTADFIITDIEEIPLLPGDALQVQSNNVNQALNVSWLWRERFLEEGERN